ncbi:hypothetical protein AC792_09480 [Arthrobacter sp. RIT-PI-e]|uniref:alpha/beta hydrolase domain-containing protein n=1 Tax=Arthrobacter sp. RIT-PI-e TaxID=1681197 RepID=UPI000675D13C|nr:alpha/beta hydrolase domain-containing protein [Arthrobacter sp. RIT-PI-e]KNC18924.1 hypothetical protein AC792_09480 [Arthrobacter sp. RIT-PI-e]
MRRSSRTSLLLTVALVVTGLSASTVPAAVAADPVPPAAPTPSPTVDPGRTPVPEVRGPLAVTPDSHPFGAAGYQEVPQDLAKSRYVEEEYLVSGTSNVYTWPDAGPAEVRTADAPYTTRVLVRRPARDHRFSGNVVVEMLNPSNLFDLNIGWALAQEQIIANGDAWVGITAKPVAVEALKTFDPQRYASLSFANPLPLEDPANCSTVAADSSRTTENGLVWDIYSQVGAWLRSDAATNPLRYGAPTTRVEHAYGFGYSQTGGFLVNYINGVHPRVVESDGAPIYDAYLVAVAGGAFAGAYPMNQCEAAPPVDDERRQFQDVGVPVMRMMSQSDYLRGIGSRRADSDEPGDRYRHYEMAGAGHATPDELTFSARSADILAAGRDVPPASCNEGPRSRFPSSIFFDAALRNLDRWVRDDIAPPRAEPILVRDGVPVLDEVGNVQGGLRSPYLDAPTSTWYGNATGASFCFIAGYEVPLAQQTLDGLYRNRADYVRAVKESTRALERQGFLTDYDAQALRREAAKSRIPS